MTYIKKYKHEEEEEKENQQPNVVSSRRDATVWKPGQPFVPAARPEGLGFVAAGIVHPPQAGHPIVPIVHPAQAGVVPHSQAFYPPGFAPAAYAGYPGGLPGAPAGIPPGYVARYDFWDNSW